LLCFVALYAPTASAQDGQQSSTDICVCLYIYIYGCKRIVTEHPELSIGRI